MARPEDFVPARKMLTDDQAEARTLPRRKIIVAEDKKDVMQSYGVTKALREGNGPSVRTFLDIRANKAQANNFVTRERTLRAKDNKIQERQRLTGRLPPETIEEIPKDPDLGMDIEYPEMNMEPGMPGEVDPLYVEKPIDKYEPFQLNRGPPDPDRLIKRKWKPQPQTQAEVRDCSIELSGE
jgi:hypothetical protein